MSKLNSPDPRTQLTAVVAEVRRKWRMKLALRGAAALVLGIGVVLLGSALVIDAMRFDPGAIVGFRIAAVVLVLGLVAVLIVRPMRRRVTDSQVALYVEEHEPSLEASILSAVETVDTANASASPALLDKLVQQATEQCRALNTSQTIDQQARRRFAAALVIVIAGIAALVSLGPESMRAGLSALLLMTRAEAASPYAIDVLPGNVKAPRGSDQNVTAELKNFSSDEVILMMRSGTEGDYVRVSLVPGLEDGKFEGILFDLMQDIEYFIESNGVRSATYTMTMVDLPAVKEVDHEYRFPAYTRLPPQTVEGGGDIASVKGTVVSLKIESTMATTGGRIVFGDDSSQPLQVQADGTLTGQFTVEKKGFYRIELEGPNKEGIAASPSYTVDVLEDMAPTVKFIKPGRDTSASAVEEVFLEATAEDDFGVKSLDLVYSVNGGEEKTVRMYGAGAAPRNEVSAGHTVYLEELGVKVGDSVSYYAVASDNDGVAGSKVTMSDIYFVKIRPFQQAFRPGQSQEGGGGGGGGGGGEQQGALSEKQRQVISATFNLNRDKAKMPAQQFKEDAVVIALSQSKLKDEVAALMQQMAQRLGGDAEMQGILQTLKKASDAMDAAEKQLRAEKTKEALAPENQALKFLQDAETTYESEVRERQQQQGGGGGGGGGAMAEDLADLFELERDRLANQYELQQRASEAGQQQGGATGDQAVDEVAQRLKELAERQLQEAERQRRQAAAKQGAGGSTSGQRALAEELEELARQLERLSRDQQREQEQRQQLADEARRMQESANQMRRAAANGQQEGGSQAAAAAQQLQEAQRRLQNATAPSNPQQAVQDAQRRAQEVVNQQKAIQSQVGNLPQQGQAGRDQQVGQITERKNALNAQLGELEKQLNQTAAQMRGQQREVGEKLREAADGIRNDQIKEKVEFTRSQLPGTSPQNARDYEQSISSDLERMQNRLNQAAQAMGNATRQNAQTEALDRARNALRGLESLNERMQQSAEDGAQAGAQQGAQQQGAQQGQQMTDGRSGQPNAGMQRGPSRMGGASGDARNTGQRFTAEEARQFRRELTERTGDIQQLRQALQQAGVDARDLDEVVRQLRQLDSETAFGDPLGVQELTTAALEKLKKFEFDLRKKLDTTSNALFLNGNEEIPANFRNLVEEYYKSLAKKGGK